MNPDDLRPILDFEIEIDLFSDYLAAMEEFLEKEAQEHRERLDEIEASNQVKRGTDELSPEEEYEHFHLDLIGQFANLLRRSFFVTLYSYLESRLVRECRSRKADNVLVTYSDIAGQNDIDRAKVYFTKILRVSFPSDTAEWQEIQNYRLLRNCLVHHQGKLDEDRSPRLYKALREYITRKQTLSIKDGEVFLRKGFGEEAYSTIKDFLSLLLFSFRIVD